MVDCIHYLLRGNLNKCTWLSHEISLFIVVQLWNCGVLYLSQSNMEFKKRFRLQRLRQKKQVKDGRKPLLKNVQHTETTDGEQILKNMERTKQSVVYPDLILTEVTNGDTALKILRKILSTHSNPQDLNIAAGMVETWVKSNGVTMDKKEDTYCQVWLCEFLQEIDQSVEIHFPILPVEGTQRSEQLEEFLQSAENIMCSEVHRLTTVLKDAGLLGYLIKSYSHQLFTKLDLLLNRDLSLNEVFCLLQWGKRVFFSPDSQDVFRVHDPLMFSGWFERAKKKVLGLLKKDISRALQNILCYEEQHEDDTRSMNEEWFIRVHIDVTQCLSGAIQNAKPFSLTLMHKVQELCLGELHSFVQKYVHKQRKCLENLKPLKTDSVYLFRIINTCMQLRCLAVQICDQDKNKSDDIVCMMKQLEDHVYSIVQKMMKYLAQVRLKSYFEKEDEHICNLTEEIQMQFASLPQTAAAEEIKTIFVSLVYDCVSRVYLDCLMKNKFKRLEQRWGNVEEMIRQDVTFFHDTFTQLNGIDEQKQLLRRMSEVLSCRDPETLKLTCSDLFKDFSEDSEQYLPGLLRWNRTLSKRQVREVLDVARLGHPNPARDNPQSLMGLCCWLGH